MTRIAEQIAAIDDTPSELVVVPEWMDVKLELRGLSVAEARAVAKDKRLDDDDDYYAMVRWVIAGAFDPDTNEHAFEESDADMLLTKTAKVVGELAEKVLRLSGIETAQSRSDKAAGVAANPSEGSPKNSTATPTSATSSTSPEN